MCNLHWPWCYTFCPDVTLFALVLHLNCTALSQSESLNFFMYIINFVSTLNPGHKCTCSRYSWPSYRCGWLSSICSSYKTFPLHVILLGYSVNVTEVCKCITTFFALMYLRVNESEWGWMMVYEGEWRWMTVNESEWWCMRVNDSE